MTNPELNTLWLHDRVGRIHAGDREACQRLNERLGGELPSW